MFGCLGIEASILQKTFWHTITAWICWPHKQKAVNVKEMIDFKMVWTSGLVNYCVVYPERFIVRHTFTLHVLHFPVVGLVYQRWWKGPFASYSPRNGKVSLWKLDRTLPLIWFSGMAEWPAFEVNVPFCVLNITFTDLKLIIHLFFVMFKWGIHCKPLHSWIP